MNNKITTASSHNGMIKQQGTAVEGEIVSGRIYRLAQDADDAAELSVYLMGLVAKVKARCEEIGGDDVALQMELGEIHARCCQHLALIQARSETHARQSRPAGVAGGAGGRPPASRGGRVIVEPRRRKGSDGSGWPAAVALLILIALLVGGVWAMSLEGILKVDLDLPDSTSVSSNTGEGR